MEEKVKFTTKVKNFCEKHKMKFYCAVSGIAGGLAAYGVYRIGINRGVDTTLNYSLGTYTGTNEETGETLTREIKMRNIIATVENGGKIKQIQIEYPNKK